MLRIVTLVMALVMIASCSPQQDGLAVVANGHGSLGLGPQRLVVAHRADDGTDLADPDAQVELELTSPSGSTNVHPVEFVWMIEDVRGLYVANVEFDEAGTWNAVLRPKDGPPTFDSPFSVDEDSVVPDVGEPAIPSQTVTSADSVEDDLSDITTDTDPDPALYQHSLAELVANGQPTVLVFATPAFCQTATCGPMLDQVKSLRAELDSAAINWIHVEVYSNLDDPAALELVPAVVEWGLPSEPWAFVIDEAGTIIARFEGVVGNDELRNAVGDALS